MAIFSHIYSQFVSSKSDRCYTVVTVIQYEISYYNLLQNNYETKHLSHKQYSQCHYNVCHYNTNASLTRSILGSQTAPTCPHDHPRVAQHMGKRCEIIAVWSATATMTPLCSHTNGIKQRYPTCWLCQYSRFMIDLQSNTYYSSPVLWECHHQTNMATRRPDVENNPSSNQVNISHTQVN